MSGWALVRERARLADTAATTGAVLLASACLIPLFDDLSWALPTAVVVLVIAALGTASRGLALPLPLVPVVEALGLILAVTALFAGSRAWAGLLPTTPAWDDLGALLRQGLIAADALAAPVPTLPGLVLLAVGGVGLVALSADTLFVSVRSPLLAGLPLLALYLAGALMPVHGAPWWTFAATATGWLLILAADQRDRVREWGGLSPATRIRGLSSGARRVGLLTVALATVIGVGLPAVGASAPWRNGDGPATATATGTGPVVLDPLVSMRRSLLQANDTEVLRYRTQADRPSYLRVTALEDFDGTTWRPRPGLASGRDTGVPLPGDVLEAAIAVNAANRVTGGASYTYDITVTSLVNAYLPLPYPVSEVTDVKGLGRDWRMDPATGIAFSADRPATGRSYRVIALDPRVAPERLRGAAAPTGDFWPQLQLPGGMSPRIRELATTITASATTPYDKAVALQRWFTRDGGFTYSTSVPAGASADYVAQFLDDRVGYCEQFASAMAIMARTLGIPSRVVVGFTQGTRTSDGDWRVTVRDAHAWPELWFDGVGWVRFEPTPRDNATVQAPDYAPATAPLEGPDSPALRELLADQEVPTGTITRSSGPAGILRVAVLGALLLAVVLLAVPMVRRVARRRRRLHGRGPVAEGAWAEVGDLAIDLGQAWPPTSTPRQAADRLTRGMPEPTAAAVQRLRQEVEQVRYARGGSSTQVSVERAEAIRDDVRTVARELRGRVRWQTRLLAYCWPSSERRRQRSSMRFMKPGEDGGFGAASPAAVASRVPAARAPKAE